MALSAKLVKKIPGLSKGEVSLYSPDFIIMLGMASFLDFSDLIFEIIGAMSFGILKLLLPIDPIMALIILFWLYFRQGRMFLSFKKSLFAFLGELIPLVGILPFLTISVLSVIPQVSQKIRKVPLISWFFT